MNVKTLDDLDPYNPDADCPKCGHPTVDTYYNDRDGIPDPKEVIGALTRRCDDCGYQWNEAPLDHDEDSGA